ncbi:hypothetical protein LTR10_003785 [Elasticomyces elasticus]|nr:hypothetical protein LTR10_003785 [Elasticomyces elasticus]KAK4978027.1 hypothetical protein LTR42_002402 [Elasticomyces elasticus]
MTMDTAANNASLLGLPYELRKKILDLAVRRPAWPPIELQPPRSNAHDNALFSASRALREESLKPFFRLNTCLWTIDFKDAQRIDPAGYESMKDSDFAQCSSHDPLHSIGLTPSLPWNYPYLKRDLRRLNVDIYLPSNTAPKESWEMVRRDLERMVCALDYGRRLEHLYISFAMIIHSQHKPLMEEQLAALDTLAGIKPRGCVHIYLRHILGQHGTTLLTPRQSSGTKSAIKLDIIRQRVQIKEDPGKTSNIEDNYYNQSAANLSQDVGQAEKDHFQRVEAESKDKQIRSPWMREGSDVPPVSRNRSAGAMTKGKLLTTPSRMLKLILPLTTKDTNHDRKDVEPLALLVHPQQPLSYLERLIQSELPTIPTEKGERAPVVTFRAQDTTEEDIGSGKTATQAAKEEEDTEQEEYELENGEETRIGDKVEKTGKISSAKAKEEDKKLPRHGHASDKAAEVSDPDHPNFVRWSPSTEIGDFIRDAARGTEFAVDIEGAPEAIYVGVPSFADRTYYLRMRLRKTAKKISASADIKRECDELAQRGAKRVAQSGFAGLLGWWGLVYYLTFQTDLGWDVMEPVTYLVGLSGLIGGYTWFLYHNREVSYRSAMNFTVSRRQSQLYEKKGFDVTMWEGLVEEGNRLRREIKMVADEYDVEWDERKEEGSEKVAEELRKARQAANGSKKKKGKDDDGDDD